jgi:hypothetical protein
VLGHKSAVFVHNTCGDVGSAKVYSQISLHLNHPKTEIKGLAHMRQPQLC